jgi:hypothetical protein
VDEAWEALRAGGPIEIPREPLDRLYSWDNVARTLLETCAGSPARSRGSSVAA